MLLAGNFATANGEAVSGGAAAGIGLYASGRPKALEYSPVLLMLVSGGAVDFLTTFRMGIFASECDLISNGEIGWKIGLQLLGGAVRGPQLVDLHP